MTSRRNVKVIFDTNVWISFLIGKRLQSIKGLISIQQIITVFTEQLLKEIKLVSQRPKLKKYFPHQSVLELIDFLEIVGKRVEVISKHHHCSDPKDNFLLDLIDKSKADYLVTGDKALIELNPFKTAKLFLLLNLKEK